ncbi:hypothetical protein BATDEDRAFT_86703 [Batrachochytrium dendrobatidis JAM81]|uniref:Uncharacterized protein n=1 Tax=Batrachochytrium dendrobatidis (strain JAM81 / FGSC 10211) TaxID=684364 RepID=F4NWU7_BATDJ|nr:uncharacterized protein BATDEDRAFT_86703 [Batrachochytrium dendrobatidis JAM81]EGF82551.1 hypothetical protein BATDEDRAFT_86703 [Batrachochytrium dendrobatidis JAM81]|eukprot:XP_006676967.1 hypothetical protein BATDEDRAFT_86703 [Batrachochytrium dendrobatidis JAM81]
MAEEDYEFDTDAMDYDVEQYQASSGIKPIGFDVSGSMLFNTKLRPGAGFTDGILTGNRMRANTEDIIMDQNFFNGNACTLSMYIV